MRVIAMTSRFVRVLAVVGVLSTTALGQDQDVAPPMHVKVLSIFLVPRGETEQTSQQSEKLIRHLEWSQTRYSELLPGKNTFAIAERQATVIKSDRDLTSFRALGEDFGPRVVEELLAHLKFNRYTCPYVLLTVMMNPKDDFPVGGGRPLNGGFNTGGGLIVLSSFALDQVPNFQSTLQHELGHSFGLPHVDVYGYDMKSNASFMSYNQAHRTSSFNASQSPGAIIPEDLRGLALNKRVFPKLVFDPKRDIPPDYPIAKRIIPLGPMKLEGQPAGIEVTTSSGETFGSKVSNCAQGEILPNLKTGQVTFDGRKMWSSGETKTGWVSLEIRFPVEVELTKIGIHSQHSGEYHAAIATRIAVQGKTSTFREVVAAPLKSTDATVALKKTKGCIWQFDFQAGPSKMVVLRGLRFFSGDNELFPPLVPYQP